MDSQLKYNNQIFLTLTTVGESLKTTTCWPLEMSNSSCSFILLLAAKSIIFYQMLLRVLFNKPKQIQPEHPSESKGVISAPVPNEATNHKMVEWKICIKKQFGFYGTAGITDPRQLCFGAHSFMQSVCLHGVIAFKVCNCDTISPPYLSGILRSDWSNWFNTALPNLCDQKYSCGENAWTLLQRCTLERQRCCYLIFCWVAFTTEVQMSLAEGPDSAPEHRAFAPVVHKSLICASVQSKCSPLCSLQKGRDNDSSDWITSLHRKLHGVVHNRRKSALMSGNWWLMGMRQRDWGHEFTTMI